MGIGLCNKATRKESFGGVIGSQGKILFLEKDGYAFMQKLLKKEVFSINDISSTWDLDKEDTKQFFSLLMVQNFLTATIDQKGGDVNAEEEVIVGENSDSA